MTTTRHRRGFTWAVGGTALALALACGGRPERVAYGVAPSGEPFTLTYTPVSEAPHQLWFYVDLGSDGDYAVTGTVSVEGGRTWEVAIRDDGPPIGEGRVTSRYEWSAVEVDGRTYAKGMVYGTEIPGGTAPVTLTGKLTMAPNTSGNVNVVVAEPPE